MQTLPVPATPAVQEVQAEKQTQTSVVKQKPRQGFLGSLSVTSFIAVGALTAVIGTINMIASQRATNQRDEASSTIYCRPDVCSEVDQNVQLLKGVIVGGLIACAGLLVWKLSVETDSDEIFNDEDIPNIK